MLQNERLRELIATHSLPIKKQSMEEGLLPVGEASRKIARRLIAVPLSRPCSLTHLGAPIWPSGFSCSRRRILQPKVGIITSGQGGIHSAGGYSPAIHRRSFCPWRCYSLYVPFRPFSLLPFAFTIANGSLCVLALLHRQVALVSWRAHLPLRRRTASSSEPACLDKCILAHTQNSVRGQLRRRVLSIQCSPYPLDTGSFWRRALHLMVALQVLFAHPRRFGEFMWLSVCRADLQINQWSQWRINATQGREGDSPRGEGSASAGEPAVDSNESY